MKLYSTVTSERASKGQGGNDKLIIEIQVGSQRKLLARLHVEQIHGNVAIYSLIIGGIGGDKIAELIDTTCLCPNCALGKTKGKKKKDECRHDYDNYGKCCNCGKFNY